MKRKKTLLDRWKKQIVVLDGAMGTELQKRGLPAGACPEAWCLEHPRIIGEVHRNYRDAGSDVVYTGTFGANRLKLAEYGITDVFGVNRKLALTARAAVGPDGLVAGDIGPTGRFVEPFGDLAFEDAVSLFKEQIGGLVAGKVDLLVIETILDIQEARAALIAARELTDGFVMVTMTFEEDGKTLNGTDPVTALVTLQGLGADAVGCNCSAGPVEMIRWIAAMKPYATVPLVAKPNAGMPELREGRTVFPMGPGEFARHGKKFASLGVGFIGGCCGSTPEHIRALAGEIRPLERAEPARPSLGAVTSARKTLVFEETEGLVVVGERLNPTGKKTLQEELRAGKWGFVRSAALEQEEKGARLLDVNAAVPGEDEVKLISGLVSFLSRTSDLPLVIDSAHPGAVEKALRLYPGRALLNSITGEKKKIEEILPVAARYGTPFILLPVDDEGVPETWQGRREVIRRVWKTARSRGFSRDDLIVDGLVMTVSSNPGAPRETLETIRWSTDTFRCRTLVGLSNVSFGLPERKWLNGAFLAMAAARGARFVIANPAEQEVMALAAAADMLLGEDPQARRYVSRFAGTKTAEKTPRDRREKAPGEAVFDVIVEGRVENIEESLLRALREGLPPGQIVQAFMIPAITRVGEFYEKRRYFLPQLLSSAEAMKKGLSLLEPELRARGEKRESRGRIVLATVQGDIHDIGKNIVSLLLENQGFEVIDLGKDVSAERIVAEIRRTRPFLTGLSALMTTTMTRMDEVIGKARAEGIDCPFLVGGAVLTPSYARSIGARYAADGVEAVRAAEEILKERS